MKKFFIIGVLFLLISGAADFYVKNYYCANNDYCTYIVGDGITENLIYLSLVFLAASSVSLVAGSSLPWLVTFGILTIVSLFSSQTCSSVGCFSRESVLILTATATLLVALVANLIKKFRNKF